MKVNTGKSHLLLSGNSRTNAMIDNSYIESEEWTSITRYNNWLIVKRNGKIDSELILSVYCDLYRSEEQSRSLL